MVRQSVCEGHISASVSLQTWPQALESVRMLTDEVSQIQEVGV